MIFFFSILQLFWNGYKLQLKKSGRGDTEHRREIVKADLDLIEDQQVVLLNIMRARDERNYDKYWDLIKQLQPEWRDKYNYLLQYGAMYIIMTATAKRANEGTFLLIIHNLRHRKYFLPRFFQKSDFFSQKIQTF